MSAPGPSWREALAAYIRQQANPTHKYGHQPRLYALAQRIATASPALQTDDEILFAAAYTHDLGVFVGHRPEDPEVLRHWDHVAYCCERAPLLLTQFGFPEAKIAAVLACIREHQPQDRPTSPEATVLRDADILEQLGAVGILRTASKLGSDTRFPCFADAHTALRRALETLPGQLHLSASKALAAPRLEVLSTFLSALEEEAGGYIG